MLPGITRACTHPESELSYVSTSDTSCNPAVAMSATCLHIASPCVSRTNASIVVVIQRQNGDDFLNAPTTMYSSNLCYEFLESNV